MTVIIVMCLDINIRQYPYLISFKHEYGYQLVKKAYTECGQIAICKGDIIYIEKLSESNLQRYYMWKLDK